MKRKWLIIVFATFLLASLCCLVPIVNYCTHSPAKNVEVIASACKDPMVVDASPDGKALWIYEKFSKEHYLYNLYTQEKIRLPSNIIQLWDQSSGILKMMSSEFLLREGILFLPAPNYHPYQVINLLDGNQFSLLDIGAQIEIYSPDGNFNPEFIKYFTSADQVYVHRQWKVAIAIAPNFTQHPEQNIVLHEKYLKPKSNDSDELIIEFLNKYHVNYQIIDVDLVYKDNYSPLGNYSVRGDGIHLKNGNLIMDIRSWEGNFKGWYYDESAIIVQPSTDWLIIVPDVGNLFRIAQPILKVPLPVVTPIP